MPVKWALVMLACSACAADTFVGADAAPADASSKDSPLACKSSSDCAQGVCCVSQSNNVDRSSCASQCDSNQAQLCDPTSANPACPIGEPCSTDHINDWGLPSGFATCGGVGVP